MKVEYSSNNSGGGWWLKDKHWLALEKAGWEVEWGGKYFCHSKFSGGKGAHGKPEPCISSETCPGHRRFDSMQAVIDADDRWLGAVAREASKEFPSIADAIREFEKITGLDASDEGCNCCGAPHSFNAGGEYASGEAIAELLTGVRGLTYRQALEAAKDKP